MQSVIRRCYCWFLTVLIISLVSPAAGAIRLPRLVSDGMVLQRNAHVKIWGWADPDEAVTVQFAHRAYSTAADEAGQWQVTLDALSTGGPYDMRLDGDNQITLKDIWVGDVWVCSGQSNMDLTMRRLQDRYPEVIANARNDKIRQFMVPREYDFDKPRQDLSGGRWEAATPETVLDFTAVGYFFARSLYDKYQVPIGLINATLGGSPAEAWLSEEALQAFPSHLQTAKRFGDAAYVAGIEKRNRQNPQRWYARLDKTDRGLTAEPVWSAVDVDDTNWPTMTIPGYWAEQTDLGPVNGVVWFRRHFEVPDAMVGKPAKLLLGRIVDADQVYLNGKQVGATTYQYPPRRYLVDAGALKAGTNVLAVRVINTNGQGGFVLDKPYELSAGEQTIDLTGPWKYKLGATMPPLEPQVFIRWKPMGLYNGMIAPLTKYAVKGVLWFQGESNVGRAGEYATLFPAVINDWRRHWGQGDFPFLYVQLANYLPAKETPAESAWAELRQAQLQTLTVDNTAMAVAIDIGEWNDIHPLNKEAVGQRLALAARKLAYGDDIVYSGPVYRSMKINGDKIILSFTHTGGGLIAQGDKPLGGFAIAGADRKYVWANAKIQGDRVIVWSDAVAHPAAVRYAWADNPDRANLYNVEGLPASPFSTDGEREL